MARATDRQQRQRELAWLLFQIRGAKGNFRPFQRHVPDAIYKRIQSLRLELDELEKVVLACLSHDANLRAQSFRRTTTQRKKVSP